MQDSELHAPPARIACPDCGEKIPSDAAACMNCGKRLWILAPNHAEPPRIAKGFSVLLVGAVIIAVVLMALFVLR